MSSVQAQSGVVAGQVGLPRQAASSRVSEVLAIGFGTTVAMWGAGYVGRLPAVTFPAPLLLALLLACLIGGGVALGRWGRGGWPAGLAAGLLTGLLNLLVLGSLLGGEHPNQVVPSAAIWVPGSIAVTAVLVGLGAWLGSRGAARRARPAPWTAVLVRVAIAATMLLLAVGGLVTSHEAGLAVVDWPNSYGYNMFLYPLSRMTGGIYYEHAHRLFGALVGLTMLVLAVRLSRVDPRPFVRRLGWLALGMVIVQGILGGLRVTGSFTLSTDAGDMAPSLALAVVHGVFAQVFLGTLVALGAFTSPRWLDGPEPTVRASARADRLMGWILVVMLLVQLVLGAMQRHTSQLLGVHIAMAALVAPLALHVGFRSWGVNPDQPQLQRWGIALAVTTGLQLMLGIGAFAMIGAVEAGAVSRAVDVGITTAHQWCGAILLACAVTVLCWTHRLLRTS